MSSPRIRNSFQFALIILMVAMTAFGSATFAQVPEDELSKGIELYKSGNTKDAIEVFRAVIKKQEANAIAWRNLGVALHRDGQIREARKAFQKAVKLQANDVIARSGLAYTLLLEDKLSEAKREAEATLALKPTNSEALYVKGVVYLREGELAVTCSPG